LHKAPHRVCIVYDEKMQKHCNISDNSHPEKPNRIASIYKNHEEHGLLQPIIVIENNDGTYTVVAGERRIRAHKLAQIDEIKAIIVNENELKLRELALIENIQRDDLNIIELAFCYAQLLNEHNITHEELSKRVSKSRTSITNTLRLLQLSPYVQQFLTTDKLTAGHAKIMIGLDIDEQKKVCDKIIEQQLSVRETEKLIKELKEQNQPKPKEEKQIHPYRLDTLQFFANVLKNDKIKVKLDANYIKIEFNSQEDIDRLASYFNIQ